MKTNIIACFVAALNASAVLVSGQSQTVLDLLRSIQPGQPPPTQPASQPVPAAAPQVNPPPAAPAPVPVLDTKPVFMSVTTNYVRVTNAVIVTNYVVVTNLALLTNYYNSQGQLLVPIQPGPGSVLAFADAKPSPAPAPAPDPALIRSNRLQAVRELLSTSLAASSNTLSAQSSFSSNPNYQIRIPEGVTVFDRKKGQNLTTAMNTAAEKAVPAAFSILQKSVAQLNPPDPAQILQGGNDSATQFLLGAEGQNFANQILTVVQGAAADAHVPEAYNSVMLRGGGLLGAVLGTQPSVDLNAHITRGLMGAIFLNLSSQENLIRTDPSARKTKTLQDAFAK